MNLTTTSLGFGARSGNAGVVTLGFGTSGAAPPVNLNLTVITLGFGKRTGTAGVVTQGYGTGGITPIIVTHGDGDNEDKKRFKRAKERRHEDIQAAWEALLGAPVSMVREAKQIARPAIKAGSVDLPKFEALPDYRIEQLIALYRELDDEEVILFLL